jgi:membrane protein implicated in regulation of membrane protease activity
VSWLLTPPFLPFAIAALVLLVLVVLEVAGTFVGTAPSHLVEATSAAEAIEGAVGWLNLGRVPLLILLITLLAVFAVCGIVLQIVASKTVGYLPVPLAALLAAAAALPVTRWVSRGVARIVPRDETYAVKDEDLIGRVGTVTVGPLAVAFVGRARVEDSHGNAHFPRVRPADRQEEIEVGARVLLVERAGREFRVIRAPAGLAGR